MTGYTFEMEQKERDEILGCCDADIRALAPYVKEILAGEALCVIGNAEKIQENAGKFEHVEPLF